MSGTTSGLAQSVHTRLIRHAQSLGVDPNLVLTRFATERLLYRLSRSRHAERFVLKGALLLLMWLGETIRPTRDADLLGFGDVSDETLAATLAEVCVVNVEPDGMAFDPATIRVAPIRPQDIYGGKRVALLARLGAARIPVQVDVGIGDAVVPPPEWCDYPSLLDLPCPRLRAYRPETAIAEKAHAMVLLGTKNSRMRDFFDVYQLAQHASFDGPLLAGAIRATFERRKTAIPGALPSALTPAFAQADDKRAQWSAFLRKNRLTTAPKDLETVLAVLAEFLGSVFDAEARAGDFRFVWQPGGPWAPLPAGRGLRREQSTEERQTLRRFKPYPAYKDSGVEWLGEIPAHWAVKRLKYLARLNPESLGENTDPGLEIVYMDIGGVDSLGRIVGRESLAFGSAPTRARRLVRDGDVIVSTVRTYLRAIAAIKNPEPNLVVSTGFAVVRPSHDLTTEYAAYTLRAPYFVERVVANSTGVSFPAINESEIATYVLAVPPLSEQRAIAAFLDRETAKIDALVAKKERLVELLQEKRTALITQAVTKGLDPNVPMRDSGVEWLGEIPAHWEVALLKRFARIRYGLSEPPADSADGVPFVRATDISRGRINTDSIKHVDPEDVPWQRNPRLSAGEILVVRSGAYTGDSAIVPPELAGAVAGYDMVVTCSRIEPRFVAWALLSRYIVEGQIDFHRTRAAQPHLNAEELASCLLIVPSPEEQRAIADFLDQATARIDALIAKVREGIERLKEYRTAVISAAVTGKIDVREQVGARQVAAG